MNDQAEDIDKALTNWQGILMKARQIQLSLGCAALLYIIILTLYKKHYVYNTTKLFMFFSICQFIGMFIVLLHLPSFTANFLYYYNDLSDYNLPHPEIAEKHLLTKVLTEMKQKKVMVWCAFEAFVNLFAYNLGYFFAVLITYNVYCVINQCNRNFMKSVFRSKRVLSFLVFLFLVFLTPFILSMAQSKNQYGSFYQYGPDGFPIRLSYEKTTILQQPHEVNAQLIFLCGMVGNSTDVGMKIVALTNSYFCPFSLFIIHFWFLRKNRKSMITIQKSQYLNSKQLFILKSGKVSLVVFIIQGLSFIKTIFSMLLTGKFIIISTILNYIFDLYPFVILYFYNRYTQQKKGLRNSSTSILTDE